MKLTYAAIVASLAIVVPAASAGPTETRPRAKPCSSRNARVCHKIGPGAVNFVGPDLNGVIGRKAGTEAGYSYSDGAQGGRLDLGRRAAQQMADQPKADVAGTKMIFPGLPKESDRANVIAYISQFKADGSK